MRGIPGSWIQARMGSMRLGEILMDHDVLNKSQLRCALVIAKERGKRIGELLVDMELATPDQVSSALAEQGQMEIS